MQLEAQIEKSCWSRVFATKHEIQEQGGLSHVVGMPQRKRPAQE